MRYVEARNDMRPGTSYSRILCLVIFVAGCGGQSVSVGNLASDGGGADIDANSQAADGGMQFDGAMHVDATVDLDAGTRVDATTVEASASGPDSAGPPPTCDNASCPTGCCDPNGICQPGTSNFACGVDGLSCWNCSTYGGAQALQFQYTCLNQWLLRHER
jgi:hypothetical protein